MLEEAFELFREEYGISEPSMGWWDAFMGDTRTLNDEERWEDFAEALERWLAEAEGHLATRPLEETPRSEPSLQKPLIRSSFSPELDSEYEAEYNALVLAHKQDLLDAGNFHRKSWERIMFGWLRHIEFECDREAAIADCKQIREKHRREREEEEGSEDEETWMSSWDCTTHKSVVVRDHCDVGVSEGENEKRRREVVVASPWRGDNSEEGATIVLFDRDAETLLEERRRSARTSWTVRLWNLFFLRW